MLARGLSRGLLVLVFVAAMLATARPSLSATCTAEVKEQRAATADAFAKQMAAKRTAYFKTHKSPALRRAFIAKQKHRLAVLRAAAACTVPPPPPPGPVSVPTVNSPCMLAPNAYSVANESNWGFPLFHEGPVNTAGALPTGGLVRAVVIAVDFSDAPATQDAAQLSNTTVAGLGRFEEYSYGRFSVSPQIVSGWRRMPRPASSYASLSDGRDGARQFLNEATGLVDAEVDFSNVQFVFVLAPGLAPFERAGNPAWSVFPGRGVVRDGNEIRHATTLIRTFTEQYQDTASTANHELAHSLGLPESYQLTSTGARFDLVGMWDLMSIPNQHHFLAWHKYRLGWLDQAQITCLNAPGTVRATLTPLETRGGMKAAVIRTSPSQAYVVETRRKLGLDANLCKEGALIYLVDSQVDNGGGAIRVQRAAEDTEADHLRCDTLHNAPFQVGQTFENAEVKIAVVSATGSGYTVELTRKP